MILLTIYAIVSTALCGYFFLRWKIDETSLVTLRNQDSKHRIERDEAKKRYDDLVESVKIKAASATERPKQRLVARNFSEYRDAAERGALPRGMREKKNANTV